MLHVVVVVVVVDVACGGGGSWVWPTITHPPTQGLFLLLN